MKYVKRNHSVFIIGEELDSQHPSHNIAKLKPDKFKYNQVPSRNGRLHSLKTQSILECLNQLEFSVFKKMFNKERIGIYINGPMDDLLEVENFQKKMAPTYNLKNTLGLIPGHISIFHEINGPCVALTSMPSDQILTLARMDLDSQIIDLAVVGFINIYEDAITTHVHQEKADSKQLTEAAGVVLLTHDHVSIDTTQSNQNHYYGYLEGLIS